MTTSFSESARIYPGGDPYPQIIHPEPVSGPFTIRHARLGDVFAVLAEGTKDWLACRTDILVLAVIYPLAALLLIGVVIDQDLLPFAFPVCAGLALLGPLATIWFAALSRQRERDGVATADSAGAIFDSSRRGSIKRLGLLLIGLFALWIVTAAYIHAVTLGTAPAKGGFFSRVFATPAGHEMIFFGVLAGAVFALFALAVGLVGFQLALDREISAREAVLVSVRASLANPGVALLWGGVIVAGLLVGALPGLLGLAVTIPILGHASWHLYRRLISGY
ncbi:DUF2189 domain-containing protein [Acidocella sp.]|uniref:DUF2189 domain-containing protein n=1 Tax=Acidocella sp. TaxID=50710 RepID=UPI003CFCE41F